MSAKKAKTVERLVLIGTVRLGEQTARKGDVVDLSEADAAALDATGIVGPVPAAPARVAIETADADEGSAA